MYLASTIFRGRSAAAACREELGRKPSLPHSPSFFILIPSDVSEMTIICMRCGWECGDHLDHFDHVHVLLCCEEYCPGELV